MSPKTTALATDGSRSRELLERRANVIRSRLLRTLDALDGRRHQVQELSHDMKRLAVPAFGSVLVFAGVAIGASFGIHALLERRRERSLGYRLVKSMEARRPAPSAPLWKDALRKVVLAGLSVAATELARRGLRAALEREAPTAPTALLPANR